VYNRVLLKGVIRPANPKILETLPIAAKKLLKGGKKQGFPESPGTGKKEMTLRVLQKIVDVFGLVSIDKVFID
jgi:hypothetical protein